MTENVLKPDKSDPAWSWLALSHGQTGLEMNFLLVTLLELELTGTVENIGGLIYRLRVELEIPSN